MPTPIFISIQNTVQHKDISAVTHLVQFLESEFNSLFSEASSADIESVFSDQSLSSTAFSACSWSLTVVSWVLVVDCVTSHFLSFCVVLLHYMCFWICLNSTCKNFQKRAFIFLCVDFRDGKVKLDGFITFFNFFCEREKRVFCFCVI